MKTFTKVGAAAAALVLGATPAAGAATLHTPPAVAADAEDAVLFCQIRNVGKTPMSVTIDGLGFAGELMESYSTTLAPGAGASDLTPSGYGTSCRFTISGNPKNARAVALYWNGADYTLALPAR